MVIQRSRRELLSVLGAVGITGLAGCGGENAAPGTAEQTAVPNTRTPSDTVTGEGTETAIETPEVTTTTESAYLLASDGDSNDHFGSAVALSNDGSTLLVGAPGDQNPHGIESGSAYVFQRTSGGWTQQAKLTYSAGALGDNFGFDVALDASGSRALISAPNAGEENQGFVLLFERADGRWQQRATLQRDQVVENALFGESVALSADGTTAIVEARQAINVNGNQGVVTIFEDSGGWSRQQELPTRAETLATAGGSVALSGDGTTLLTIPVDPGVHVFRRGNDWSHQTTLTFDDTYFSAVDVSFDGQTALLANDGASPNGEFSGEAYLYTRQGGDWQRTQTVTGVDSDARDRFGEAVSLCSDGTTAVVGAPSDELSSGDSGGTATLFTYADNDWKTQSKLVASDGAADDFFGQAVSLSETGDITAIAAPADTENGDSAGSVYLFN